MMVVELTNDRPAKTVEPVSALSDISDGKHNDAADTSALL